VILGIPGILLPVPRLEFMRDETARAGLLSLRSAVVVAFRPGPGRVCWTVRRCDEVPRSMTPPFVFYCHFQTFVVPICS
jgi:hypothetical protein